MLISTYHFANNKEKRSVQFRVRHTVRKFRGMLKALWKKPVGYFSKVLPYSLYNSNNDDLIHILWASSAEYHLCPTHPSKNEKYTTIFLCILLCNIHSSHSATFIFYYMLIIRPHVKPIHRIPLGISFCKLNISYLCIFSAMVCLAAAAAELSGKKTYSNFKKMHIFLLLCI